MTKREAQRYVWLYEALRSHGITQDEVDTLLRCSRALHTWAEHECNGEIQRDSDSYIICSQGNCAKTSYVSAEEAKGPLSINCPACGDPAPIKRHVATGKPYWTRDTSDPSWRYPTPDREAGALKRAATIAEAHGLTIYHQGDPRGCCLYLLRPGDVPEGSDPGSCYSNGIAVCID
jgi:hypothetical protein